MTTFPHADSETAMKFLEDQIVKWVRSFSFDPEKIQSERWLKKTELLDLFRGPPYDAAPLKIPLGIQNLVADKENQDQEAFRRMATRMGLVGLTFILLLVSYSRRKKP